MSAVLQQNRATVFEVKGNSMTEYRISGSFLAVLDAITSAFRNYPAAGYGTRVHNISLGNGGEFEARISRSNSCD